MAYVADLHIHSRFSRACSLQLNIPHLVEWGKLKGISLLGTGDFLHPLWLAELKSQLTEDGSGFLNQGNQGNGGDSGIKFVLTVEIASIYTHKTSLRSDDLKGKGRRIHNLVFMPSFAAVEKFQKTLLAKRANLGSDGRPIVGIPSKEVLAMALEASDKAIFIPAHVWTPWFGILGSMSGYDSLEECFEDLSPYVYGIETGLSSDPAMNWRVKELDDRSILSFSDAHSLPNLGREATVFSGNLADGYDSLWKAIKEPSVIASPEGAGQSQKGIASSTMSPRNDVVIGTIEFYPEEGKYHYSGHRNCNVKYTPEETAKKGKICPVCKRPLTEGVMERVETLASRGNDKLQISNDKGMIKSNLFPNRPGYKMLVPLNQVIAEAIGVAKTSQKVELEYKKLVSQLGGEIKVLTKVDLAEISKISGPKIAEGVDKDRAGDLVIDPGYDGVYGVVKIWNNDKVQEQNTAEAPQLGLFD